MFVRAGIIGLLFALLVTAAPPCTLARPECTEWITYGSGTSRSLIYRTHSLESGNGAITRALIVVHGMNRDADSYFRTATAAAFVAAALEDTVVISPRFASKAGGVCLDNLAEGEIGWPCDSWRSGGFSPDDRKRTSFDFIDELLRKLASKKAFPNLTTVVLTGHSAGGQFVARYAMGNTVHEKLSVPVVYVVSNPSSYPYLDATRPSEGSDFVPYRDSRNCTTYDLWPYGLEERFGYTAALSNEQLQKQLAARPVVYLLGELDTQPLAGFDSSCPAMAQGPSRLERGQAWHRYVTGKFGARHKAVTVPLCGHNARCMYTADVALPILFPAE